MHKSLIFLLTLTAGTIVGMEQYKLALLKGSEIKKEIDFVAQQRINVFREYPYLYEGNFEEERTYLNWFSTIPHSALSIVYYGGKPVGFISGMPVSDFEDHFKGSIQALKKSGWPAVQSYYYFAEAIVLPEHRGQGLLTKLYALIEQHAHTLGYSHGCFVNESHEKHPLKPAGYKDLDNRFKAGGYAKIAAAINFNWQTLQADGSSKDQEHALQYWIKSFELILP